MVPHSRRLFVHGWTILAIVAQTISLMLPTFVYAGSAITSASDTITDETMGASANHAISFVTPSGVAEGDTITFTFPAEFDLSTITEDDVDLTDNASELTTAPDCSGSEEASITQSSNVMTITICAGDGGAITAGHTIGVLIGTNATNSGTGTHQIVNPSAIGTYAIDVAGTFGDFGTLPVIIVDSSTIAVTASVSTSGGGGGGGSVPPGGGSSGDTTPPNIFNIACSPRDTKLDITWTTDESSDSTVDYGTSSAYELGPQSDSTDTTVHEIVLTGLTAGVTYHFDVRSSDAGGNEAVSSDQSCTTTDATPPVLSNIEAINVTATTATIAWDTDESAECTLSYGTSTSYGLTKSESSFATSHTIDLTGLASDTVIHYLITCQDTSGNSGASTDHSFSTLPNLPPVNPTGFSCTAGDSEISFSWTPSTDTDIAGNLINCSTSSYPSSSSEGTTVVSATASQTSGTMSAVNDVAEYCTLFAYDTAGQFSSGTVTSCTASATAPVVPPVVPPTTPPTTPPTGVTTPPSNTGTGATGNTTPPSNISTGTGNTSGTGTTGTTGEAPAVKFFTQNDTVELTPTTNGTPVDLAPGSTFSVLVPTSALGGKAVDHIYLVLNGSTYLLGTTAATGATSGYRAYLTAPTTAGSYTMDFTVVYQDGTSQSLEYPLGVLSPGYIYTVAADGTTSRVANATVTLLESRFGVWQAADLSAFAGESNPIITGSDGSFSWYVQNGEYEIQVVKDGYQEALSAPFGVSNHIATATIQLSPIAPTIPGILNQDIPAIQKAALITSGAVNAINQGLMTLRAQPEVQVATNVAAPAAITFAATTAGLLWFTFDLLPFLQYLASIPYTIFFSGKRKAWGVVYNAANKLPIDLAIVRLYQLPENKLIATRVTDKQGRYFFLVQPGEYQILAVKPGFTFPSQILEHEQTDGAYLDLYHKETIRVTSRDATVAANIPLDPSGELQEPHRLTTTRRIRLIQAWMTRLGFALSLFVFAIRPSWLTALGVVAQVLLFLLVRRLAHKRKPKGWGIVYDEGSKAPVRNTIVRIFEPRYNKLLETSVTDNQGRYSFLVGPSEYFTTYEKEGYEKREVRPIDLTKSKEASEVAIDVALKKSTT